MENKETVVESMIDKLEQSYSYWNKIEDLYSRWAKEHGMTYESLFVLYAIYYKNGTCCQKTISEEWAKPKQTVNSILKGLKQKQYIQFKPDEQDKRNKRIELTPEGIHMAGAIMDELRETELHVMNKMGPDGVAALLNGYELFYKYLREEMQEEKRHD